MEEQNPELHLTGNSVNAGEVFIVEDLLDFSNDDGETDGGFDAVTDSSTLSVTFTDSCNSSSFSGFADATEFSGELCVPCDDVAELEWLSNFVEESFSSEDQDKLHLLSGLNSRYANGSTHSQKVQSKSESKSELESEPDSTLNEDISVPAKARSKRSRAAANGNWASRLLIVNPTDPVDPFLPMEWGQPAKKKSKKKSFAGETNGNTNGECDGRRCLHCATDKTPQWRTGPMGPKTLCNACGVRYKSGRLVPEYRPAASPTFVLTKHSNSHRKVMELRRQKEVMVNQQQMQQEQFLHQLHHEKILMDVNKSNGEDFLIHHHVGPDFRQLI